MICDDNTGFHYIHIVAVDGDVAMLVMSVMAFVVTALVEPVQRAVVASKLGSYQVQLHTQLEEEDFVQIWEDGDLVVHYCTLLLLIGY